MTTRGRTDPRHTDFDDLMRDLMFAGSWRLGRSSACTAHARRELSWRSNRIGHASIPAGGAGAGVLAHARTGSPRVALSGSLPGRPVRASRTRYGTLRGARGEDVSTDAELATDRRPSELGRGIAPGAWPYLRNTLPRAEPPRLRTTTRGVSSRACSPRRSAAACSRSSSPSGVLKEMDAGRSVGVSEVWAPNRVRVPAVSIRGCRALRTGRDRARRRELKEVVRENADERGWGLVGPPEITFDDRRIGLKHRAIRLRRRRSVRGSRGDRSPAVSRASAAVDAPDPRERRRRVRSCRSPRSVITIGRLPECDVVLNDKGASRRHAQIARRTTASYTLTDLGSTNGTRLNGQTVQIGRAVRRRPHHDRHHGAGVPEGMTVSASLAPSAIHVVAEGVTPFALSALKYGLFALLFLFVWRSMRWAVRGLSVEAGAGTRRTYGSQGSRRRRGPTVPPAIVRRRGPRRRRQATHRPGRDASSLVIGRAPECELAIEDTYVSQQHARVFGKSGSWYVEDLGSTNGTFVNDQRLVRPGDGAAGRQGTHRHHRAGAPTMKVAGRGGHRHRAGPRGQRGLVPDRAAALRGGRRHGRASGRRGRVPAGARDDRGPLPQRTKARSPSRCAAPTAPCSSSRSDGHGRQRHGHDPHRRPGRRQRARSSAHVGDSTRVSAASRRPSAAHRRPHAGGPHGQGRRDHGGRSRACTRTATC